MNVLFTDKQKKYIANMVESGDFQNASEVVRDALRLHEIMRKRLVDDLRREIEIGLNSGVSERSGAQILADKRKQYSIS